MAIILMQRYQCKQSFSMKNRGACNLLLPSSLNHIRQRISILQIANPVPYYQNILFLDPSGYCPYLFSRIEMMVSGRNLSRVSLPLILNEKSRCKCRMFFCSGDEVQDSVSISVLILGFKASASMFGNGRCVITRKHYRVWSMCNDGGKFDPQY